MPANRSFKTLEFYEMEGENNRKATIVFDFDEHGRRYFSHVKYTTSKAEYNLDDWRFLADIYAEIKDILR